MSYKVKISIFSISVLQLIVYCSGNWNNTECNSKWIMTDNNGNLKCFQRYSNSSKFTWDEARKFCTNKEGRLAAIKSQNEYNFFRQMLLNESFPQQTHLWLGGFATYGNWRWNDGTVLTDTSYKNWEKKNDGNAVEACALIFPYYQRLSSDLKLKAGKWRVKACGFKRGYICEYKKGSKRYDNCQNNGNWSFTRNNICYEINFDLKPYYEALKICKENGGNLAKVPSKEWTDAFIEKSNTTFDIPDVVDPIWIGISKVTWKWDISKGEDKVNEYFWGPNEPSNGFMTHYITNLQSFEWRTKSDTDKLEDFVCEYSEKDPLWTGAIETTVASTIFLNTTAETAPPEIIESPSDKLGLGAVIGIIVGGTVLLFTIIGIVVFFWRRMSIEDDYVEKVSPKKDKPLPIPSESNGSDVKNNPISTIQASTLNPPPETVVSDYVNLTKGLSSAENPSGIPPVIPPRSNLTTDNVENHNSNFNHITLGNWAGKNGSVLDGQSANGAPTLTLEKVIVRTQPPPPVSSGIPDPPPIEKPAVPEKKPKPKKTKKEKPRQQDFVPSPIIKNADEPIPLAPPLPPKDFLTGRPPTDLKSKWNLTNPNITLPPTIPVSPPHHTGKGVDVRKEDGDQWLWLEDKNPSNVVVFPKHEHFP